MKNNVTRSNYIRLIDRLRADKAAVESSRERWPELAERYSKLMEFPITQSNISAACKDAGITPMIPRRTYRKSKITARVEALEAQVARISSELGIKHESNGAAPH